MFINVIFFPSFLYVLGIIIVNETSAILEFLPWFANPLLFRGIHRLLQGSNDMALRSGIGTSLLGLMLPLRLWIVGKPEIYLGFIAWEASIIIFTLAAFVAASRCGKRVDW